MAISPVFLTAVSAAVRFLYLLLLIFRLIILAFTHCTYCYYSHSSETSCALFSLCFIHTAISEFI